MASPEINPSPSGEKELAIRESQYRIGFDNLIPSQPNKVGELEKTEGVEWTSMDGLETAHVSYLGVYEKHDEGTIRTARSDRLLDYRKTDPVTGRVDQLLVGEKNGSLFVTEFQDMPSQEELELAEREADSGEPTGVNPLALHIVEECLVKDGVVANTRDLNRAIEIIDKMNKTGFTLPAGEVAGVEG